MLRSLGFLWESICYSADFIVEDTIVDISLLRMEVFVKCCTNYTVVVDADTILFQEKVRVCVVPVGKMLKNMKKLGNIILGGIFMCTYVLLLPN